MSGRALRAIRPEPADVRAERLARLRQQAVLTPSEYSALSGRSRSWVEAQIKAGVIPALRLGGRYTLKAAELRATGWL
jgi:hypothetical protein